MPLWLIERDVSGWSEADIEAAGIRAKICALWYEDMTWIRSFFDEAGGKLSCIYEAQSAEDLRTQSASGGLPCDTITLVEEVLPENIGTSVGQEVAQPPASRLARSSDDSSAPAARPQLRRA